MNSFASWIPLHALLVKFSLIDFLYTGAESNFGKISSRIASTQGIAYDYYSIMHYNAWAFSRNGRATIIPLDKSVSKRDLGQRNTFTSKDLQHINALYCEDGMYVCCLTTCHCNVLLRSCQARVT